MDNSWAALAPLKMDAVQLAQMAQMEAAYAQMQAQAMGIPASGPYGQPAAASAGPVKGMKAATIYSDADWGIPGFGEALTEAVAPITQAALIFDPSQMNEVEDIKYKVGSKILKAAKKFTGDERLLSAGTAMQARTITEEFVDWSAGAVSQAFFDKPWLEKVNLAAPLLAACLHTFGGAKIFTRTLAPMLPKYVEEALFRYAEEERVNKAMFDAVVAAGVSDNMQKKAASHLAKAYDKAHIKAPFGSTTADSAELGMLQDFVKGWMSQFCTVARDVLTQGIGDGKPQRGDQILFLTVLFQNLTDARNAALPHELTSLIVTPPPSPWSFIAETAEEVFTEVETELNKQAMANVGQGGGGGGWDGGGMAAMPAMAAMAPMMEMMQKMMGGGGWGGGGGGW